MIKILGAKRVLIIIGLVLLNAALAGGAFVVLGPERLAKQNEVRRVQAQVAGLQADIESLQVEFSQLQEQQAEYDILKAKGFFGKQDRRQAQQIFDSIQQKAGVISAVASIQSGVIEDNEDAQKAGYKVLRSPITIKIQSLDDVDVFRYLYLVEKFFPGHVAVTNINLERKAEVTGTILRSIALGNNPPLVEADVNLTWRTMIPESEVINQGEGNTP